VETLWLLADGQTRHAAGDRLGISFRTVSFHSGNVCRKTGAPNIINALQRILLNPLAGQKAS